jgi:serine/threonine-protein kinase
VFADALGTYDAIGSSLQRRANRVTRRMLKRPGLIAALLALAIVSAFGATVAYAPPVRVAIFNISNATGEPANNYLATGLTSEMLRRVALLPGIYAFPVHSAFSPSASPLARFSLNGQLSAAGGKMSLIISLQDQRPSKGALWSRSFDAQHLNNLLEVESETLSSIVSNLEAADFRSSAVLLIRAQPAIVFLVRRWNDLFGHGVASSRSPTSNNRAFDDYMRGRQLTEQMSPDTIRNGLNLLERAVSEDPGFALAYAALANASITMMGWNYIPQQTLLTNGNSFAQTAVELDPNLPEALQARALVRQTQWNWDGAKQDYLQALRLKPTYAVARRYYAILVTLMGDPEEGVRQSRLALAADPYDQSVLPGHALILYTSGRLLEAAQTLENAPDLNVLAVRRNLGETYALLGLQAAGSLREQYFRRSLDQAEKIRQMEIRSQPDRVAETPESDRMYAHFLAMQGKWQACQPWVARVEADYRKGLISPAMLAWVYTALGRKQEALDLLERAVAEKDRHMILAKVYPFLNSLRSDVRFQRLITQMGL